jgi:hypothetical protein
MTSSSLSENPVLALPQPLPPHRPGEFSVDTSHLWAAYANFVRLTGTPEELVLDFGLNMELKPRLAGPVQLTHRLVLNYYTAKRLREALRWAVEQHENVYGVIETDVQKRANQLGR